MFVAKKEVAGWPIFGWLAKLQRTVFIDRERRHRTGAATQEIAERLIGGDAVVLFAEGTSSDGNRVLPFRSALIGAVHHAIGSSTHHERVTVQPLSLAYVDLNGLPLGRAFRSRVAWYGDADLISHLRRRVRRGRRRRHRELGRAGLLRHERRSQGYRPCRGTSGAKDDRARPQQGPACGRCGRFHRRPARCGIGLTLVFVPSINGINPLH